jgi:hypothetical protein
MSQLNLVINLLENMFLSKGPSMNDVTALRGEGVSIVLIGLSV